MSDNPINLDPSSGLLPTPRSKDVKSGTQPEDSAFGQLLADQLEIRTPQKTSDAATSPLTEITAAYQPRIVESAPLDNHHMTTRISMVFDLFERYALFLGDSEKPLKEAYGILDQILNETETLQNEINSDPSLPEPLNELKNILSQLLTNARVEQVKFDRGDYLI